MSKEEQQQHITSIGGQAVMEGVMMRGPFKTAVAVRKPDGDIECKVEENGTKTRKKFWRLPIIRGCVSFVDSLVIGMKHLCSVRNLSILRKRKERKVSLTSGLTISSATKSRI